MAARTFSSGAETSRKGSHLQARIGPFAEQARQDNFALPGAEPALREGCLQTRERRVSSSRIARREIGPHAASLSKLIIT